MAKKAHNLSIEPFGPTVLVKLDKPKEKKSNGGIVLATDLGASSQKYDAARLMDTGTVVDIGPHAFQGMYEKCPIKIGDRVTFNFQDCPFFDRRETPEACCYRVVLDKRIYARVLSGDDNDN